MFKNFGLDKNMYINVLENYKKYVHKRFRKLCIPSEKNCILQDASRHSFKFQALCFIPDLGYMLEE